MFRTRFVSLCLVLVCLMAPCAVFAAEVDCDATYCFTTEDFGEELVGICITQLPESSTGTVMLGARVLQPGDILTAEQVSQMTFAPLRTEFDREAMVTYLPIYENRVDKAAVMTISIRGKEDKAPVAQDFSMETYKNLPNQGKLKAVDPEGEILIYSVTRQPRRGELTVMADGTFTYTPKKNKVGVDSFTYTATDPAGNVSREATVTIQIMKPTDAQQYTDTVGRDCRFAAEWMRNTGLFEGEKVSGQACFHPEKTVSRGEFLAMTVQLLGIPMEKQSGYSGLAAEAPAWLRPYLAAAIRSGLIANLDNWQSGKLSPGEPITGGEAAVILQNALDLGIQTDAPLETTVQEQNVPTFADMAIQAMTQNGIRLTQDQILNRGVVATILYQVSQLAQEAPGMAAIRMQQ